MAKCLKEKSYENISRQVLKEMNSRNIIDDFCRSIIADMKELDSYKRLKEISIMHSLFDPLTDEELKEKKKMEIAEIGILTLTIDSSLSELTTKKLKNFSKDIILDIIKDLKDADLTADAWSNGSQIPENRSIESNLNISEKCKNIDTTANASKSNSRNNRNVISKNHRRKSSLKSSAKHKSTDPNRQNHNNLKPMTGLSEKCETFSKKFMERNPNFLNRDDDSESDVSIGSMSSVHTSDLSSFDDVISFSSEDELGHKKKKRISINEANTKYFRGQLYDIYEAVSRTRQKASKVLTSGNT